MEEGNIGEESAEKLQTTDDFIAPRDVILQICSTFYTLAKSRWVVCEFHVLHLWLKSSDSMSDDPYK